MYIYKKDKFKVPIKSWIPQKDYLADPKMVEQCENLASLPFVFKQVALMPDGHMGYGMPIGGVLATKDVIIPNAVGVDIGCGVCVIKTSLKGIKMNLLKKILGSIRQEIPVGFKRHKKKPLENLLPTTRAKPSIETFPVVAQEAEKALYSLGTLGGGNHFIEIQKDQEESIWVMIHSGSRNLGKKVADYYNNLAVELNSKYASQVPKEYELAFLQADSEIGKKYLQEMSYCVEFAAQNRKLMMARIIKIFLKETPIDYPEFMFDIPHNYAASEKHFGENVWIHRKGATSAKLGLMGIIPGSQGTKSYLVEGLGNPDSFYSCSHGAGRKLGRKQSIASLNLKAEQKKLDDQGILHAIRGKSDLDEAPGAYKDIGVVLENEKDLIKIKTELTPLAVIKG